MDIAAMAMSLNQSKIQEAVSLSVFKMALGNKDNSANMVTLLMQQSSNNEMVTSVQPYLGGNLDITA
jgi:hypothetical protein